MNKHNLIRLGIFAQKQFQLNDNCEILDISSHDSLSEYRLPIYPLFSALDFESRPADVVNAPMFDSVKLYKAGIQSKDGYETCWIGYSKLANTLLIKETEGNYEIMPGM